MREIALDTETTGLNFRGGDRIIEIGCVEMINYVSTGKTLNFYCKVDEKISDEAQKISGISEKFLSDKKTFEEQYKTLLEFIKEDPLVIHNAEFDIGFLNNELRIIGQHGLKNKTIDTVTLARKVLNTRIANLDYLCRHFNIDLTKRQLHGALLDAQLLSEVYLELRGGKQITMDLPSKKTKITNPGETNKTNKQKIIKLTSSKQDLQMHTQMMEKIKKPIWKKYNY